MRIRKIEITDDAATVLRESTWEGDVLKLPPRQLDRKLYEAVNKVLVALGGKWARAKGGHLFPNAAKMELNEALNAGSVVDRKKTLELFETPEDLATSMALTGIGLLGRIHHPRVLEPSAGRGRIVDGFWRAWGKHEPVGEMLAIDIDEQNCLHLSGSGNCSQVTQGDFIQLVPQPDKLMDLILMNPPFANTADILHVTHAFVRWLADGGVLVAIMSPHWTFASDRASRAFRELMEQHGGSWSRLAKGTFLGEGTGVETVQVVLRKRES